MTLTEFLPHDSDGASMGTSLHNTQDIVAVLGDPNLAYNAKALQAGVEPYTGIKTVTIRLHATGEGRLRSETEGGELLQKGGKDFQEVDFLEFMANMGVDVFAYQDDEEGWMGTQSTTAIPSGSSPTSFFTGFTPVKMPEQTGTA